MNMPSVSATRLVQLDYSQPISFRVEVGGGMLGGTSYRCGDISGTCTTEEVNLPGGEALQFATLHLVTTVEDNNISTNRTSVTYRLSNGADEQVFPFELILPQGERFALYLIDLTFI